MDISDIGTKVENEGRDSSGMLSADEFNALVRAVKDMRQGKMGCVIFSSIEEYNALEAFDPVTMYVIVEGGKITQAYLGTLPFAVGGESGIPIEQVFLDFESITLELGDNKQLTAGYEPSDATNKALSWTTSNRLVATVSKGLVTSVGKGECVIKVKAGSGAFAECAVLVEVTLVALSFPGENNKQIGRAHV